ncbi:MAG TPA: glycosyltransferase family 4 protein [Candidatus Paceibacterota bacterium]|nr:glycosyltransferase family 4 protein [Candidatus Paceibacterota bacterium]
MRIAQLVSNYHAVNRTAQKAISSHTAWLTDGLVARGHELHLFASSDSDTAGTLHAVSAALAGQELPDDIQRYLMQLNASRCYEFSQREKLDIIHSHFNLPSSTLFVPLVDVPSLISVHTPIADRIKPYAEYFKRHRFISFTLAQRQQMPELNWYANIYHGVDTDLFSYSAEPEDYMLYLGRITEDKGVHLAIEAAKRAGVPLRIAGASYSNEGYWHKYIEPHINGTTVRYFGEVGVEEKIKLLQSARALLFPTQVSEVFGYSMIEAMACGTPIIGMNNGSVPEIVKDGVTGYIVDDVDGMVAAIGKIDLLDRAKVRQRAEIYFSVEKMITGYERVYRRVLEESAFNKSKRKKKKAEESEL